MLTLDTLPDSSTAEEAADHIAVLAPQFGFRGDSPDVRTLRLWRAKKQITIAGRHFSRRNLMEILGILKMRQDGLTLQNAAERVMALTEERLRLILLDVVPAPVTQVDIEPLITLQLLARGILEQYQLVTRGAVVGHLEPRRTGLSNTPLNLLQAMARLGRHYFVEDRDDAAASVHGLLQLCTTPLRTWAPRVLAELDQYADVVLIDPDYRVPHEDAELIAAEAQGSSLSDMIEHQLHEALRATVGEHGAEADHVYTAVREFIGRHPLATAKELQELYQHPELTNATVDFVRSLYLPVHASEARRGLFRRCAHCKGLISANGLCILAGCRADHPLEETTPVPLGQAYLARPEVLKFWVDPAREELRLYDALRKDRTLREHVRLYPHCDWCDVAIGETVGVDVKDYENPRRLAHRLNRGIGNLAHYPNRILAIAKRRSSSTYHDRLREQLSPDRRNAFQIMSVDKAIRHLKEIYGGTHAQEA